MSIRINIKITANAKSTYLSAEKDNFKLHVSKPPVDGKANEEIIKFFSKELSVAKSKVSILRGEKSKNKIIEIDVEDNVWNNFLDKIGK